MKSDTGLHNGNSWELALSAAILEFMKGKGSLEDPVREFFIYHVADIFQLVDILRKPLRNQVPKDFSLEFALFLCQCSKLINVRFVRIVLHSRSYLSMRNNIELIMLISIGWNRFRQSSLG